MTDTILQVADNISEYLNPNIADSHPHTNVYHAIQNENGGLVPLEQIADLPEIQSTDSPELVARFNEEKRKADEYQRNQCREDRIFKLILSSSVVPTIFLIASVFTGNPEEVMARSFLPYFIFELSLMVGGIAFAIKSSVSGFQYNRACKRQKQALMEIVNARSRVIDNLSQQSRHENTHQSSLVSRQNNSQDQQVILF